jgi:hypothetical protein
VRWPRFFKNCRATEEEEDKNRNIYIPSNSQVTLRALHSLQINSKLVWDCLQSIITLLEHNTVQLIWIPGHKEIAANLVAYIGLKAKQKPETPFV